MAEIIPFPAREEEELDLTRLNRGELCALLDEVRAEIAELNLSEPRSQTGEAYEAWSDRHEELEDFADDILDRLDEI